MGVYRAKCQDCDSVYFGERGGVLSKRIGEHRSDLNNMRVNSKSALVSHKRKLRHELDLGVHSANQRTVRDFFPYVTQVKNKIYDVFHYGKFLLLCLARRIFLQSGQWFKDHFHTPWYERLLSLKSIYRIIFFGVVYHLV